LFHHGPSSFAELSVVPAHCAIPVPTDLPLAPLALIGCAVLTGFGAVHNTARVPVGSAVVVVGCGGVGLSIVQAARLAGAHRIVAVDRLAGKLKTALRLGATAAVVVDERVESAVRAELPVGADYVFEAVGSAGAFELADRLAGRGGTVVLVGMPPEDARFPIDPLRMVYDERVVKGSWYGSCVPPRDVPRLVELYRAGELRLDELITARCSLDDINQVFRDWEVGAEARSVVTFGDPAGDRIGESR
jgi:Zn-dependent alcohol dehydrogenase